MNTRAAWLIAAPSEFPHWFIFAELDKAWPHTDSVSGLERAFAIRDTTDTIGDRWRRDREIGDFD